MKSKIKSSVIALLLSLPLFSPLAFAANGGLVPCGTDSAALYKAAQQVAQTPPQNSGAFQQNLDNFQSQSCKLSDLFKLIAKITNFLIGFAAVLTVVRLVIAGVQMIVSFGNQNQISSAKSAFSHALIGFVLVMAAFLLINTLLSWFAVKFGATKTFTFPYNPFG